MKSLVNWKCYDYFCVGVFLCDSSRMFIARDILRISHSIPIDNRNTNNLWNEEENTMAEVLRDRNGRKIGEISNDGHNLVIRDASGRKLGYYDGKVTRDASGRRVGEGNLLTSLLNY